MTSHKRWLGSWRKGATVIFKLFRTLCFMALGAFLMAVFLDARATDLGTLGQCYPILEPDLQVQLQHKMQADVDSGAWARKLWTQMQHLQTAAERPYPVGLPQTVSERTWHIDPTVVAPQAIKDAEGRVLVPKGTRANPLALGLSIPTLYFFNADAPGNVAWAAAKRSVPGQADFVLTGGSLKTATAQLAMRLFFDQGGVLSRRFQITHVPAIVRQEGTHILVQEVPAGGAS